MSKATVMTPEENDSGESKPTFFSTPKSEHAKSECCGCSCVGWSSSKRRYKAIRKNSEGDTPAKKQLFFDIGKPKDFELSMKSMSKNITTDDFKILSGFHDDEEENENNYDDYSVSSYTGSYDAVDDVIQFYFECKEREKIKAEGDKHHGNTRNMDYNVKLDNSKDNLKLENEPAFNPDDFSDINSDSDKSLDKENDEGHYGDDDNYGESQYNREINDNFDEDIENEEYEGSSNVDSEDEEVGGSVECDCRDCRGPPFRFNNVLLPCTVPNNSPVHSSYASINSHLNHQQFSNYHQQFNSNHQQFNNNHQQFNNNIHLNHQQFSNNNRQFDDDFQDDFYSIHSSQYIRPSMKHYVTPNDKVNHRGSNFRRGSDGYNLQNSNKISKSAIPTYNTGARHKISNLCQEESLCSAPHKAAKQFNNNYNNDGIDKDQYNTYNCQNDYSARSKGSRKHTNKENGKYLIFEASFKLRPDRINNNNGLYKGNLISEIKDLNINKKGVGEDNDRRKCGECGCEEEAINSYVDDARHNNTLDSHYKKDMHDTNRTTRKLNGNYKKHGGGIEAGLNCRSNTRGLKKYAHTAHKIKHNRSHYRCKGYNNKHVKNNGNNNTNYNKSPLNDINSNANDNTNSHAIKSRERSRRIVRKRLCRISRYIRKKNMRSSHNSNGSKNSSDKGNNIDAMENESNIKSHPNNLNHHHHNNHNNNNNNNNKSSSTDSSHGSFIVTTLAQI